MARKCHPTLRGGRRETKYSHGYPPSELQALASISEAFLPAISYQDHAKADAPSKAVASFYRASASRYPVPDEVAEVVTKRGFLETRILVRVLLKILSTRVGTLLVCGSHSVGSEWPYLKKFSEISLEKRERVVQKWLQHCFLTPLRLAFVFLKFMVLLVFYSQMNVEKLMKMAGSVRTGGKGTMRRKKKAVHKTTTTDDKRLQSTLKRIGVNAIPAIEEVNIFKEDVVIQFVNPKVQASVAANTWVVSGTPQNKKLQDILPQIINQLGPDNLENLKKLAEQFQKQASGAGAAEDDDDDVPELVAGETFEAAAEEGQSQTS